MKVNESAADRNENKSNVELIKWKIYSILFRKDQGIEQHPFRENKISHEFHLTPQERKCSAWETFKGT